MTSSKVGAGATPRPWRVEIYPPEVYGIARVLDARGEEVIRANQSHGVASVEDASLIVTCVNEREALLKVEGAVQRYYGNYCRFRAGDSEWPTEEADTDALRSALLALYEQRRRSAK